MIAPQLLDSSKPDSVQETPDSKFWHPLIVVFPGARSFSGLRSQARNSCTSASIQFSTPSWPALISERATAIDVWVSSECRAGLPERS